jgi:hypothetical protein
VIVCWIAPPAHSLAATIVVPPFLPTTQWLTAAYADAGSVFDGRLLGCWVIGVEERVGLFADSEEAGGGDVVVLEESARPGVAAFAVGAAHLGVSVLAVALEVVTDRLGGDRLLG